MLIPEHKPDAKYKALRTQYLEDNEWWETEQYEHTFRQWIAWKALAALVVPAAEGGGDVCRVALERIWRMLNCSEESPFCDDRTHGNLKHHDCHIHEIRDTVLHALAAAPTPGLVWTTERPTVPGWYWWRDLERNKEPEVCNIYKCPWVGLLRVNWTTERRSNGRPLSEYDLGEWSGPIPEPEGA